MQHVKEMVKGGTSIPAAIKDALAQKGLRSIAAFARKHSLIRATASSQINGILRATDDVVAALIAELGGTSEEWRELLWLASRPATEPGSHTPARRIAGARGGR